MSMMCCIPCRRAYAACCSRMPLIFCLYPRPLTCVTMADACALLSGVVAALSALHSVSVTISKARKVPESCTWLSCSSRGGSSMQPIRRDGSWQSSRNVDARSLGYIAWRSRSNICGLSHICNICGRRYETSMRALLAGSNMETACIQQRPGTKRHPGLSASSCGLRTLAQGCNVDAHNFETSQRVQTRDRA